MKTFDIAYQKIVQTPEEILALFDESIKLGFEGIMAKKLDGVYQAGGRNFNWVKLKHLAEGKLVDTLDCVVMGYYKGQGKRTGFGIGAFLVGILDRTNKTNRTYKTIAKIGTGLSDQQWKEMKARSKKYEAVSQPEEYRVDKNLAPDVWLKPHMVVEIAADEITKSPIHTAGLALRFPRLVSFRTDKDPDDATTIGEVAKLYQISK